MKSLKRKTSWLLLILAFLAIYIIWGTTYLAIAYALKSLGPFVISALRYLAAGLILTCWVLLRELRWPDKHNLRILIVSGILMLSGGSGLVVMGEKYISSGFAAVIVATEPLFFVLFDASRWKVYFSNRWIIAGLLTGFAGIALFACFAPASGNGDHSGSLLGICITLLSAISWVGGSLYANRNLTSQTSNTVNSTVQLLAAGAFSALIAGWKGEWSELLSNPIPLIAWGGLIYLIIMGSLVTFLSFNWLITVQPPAIVSTHTFVNPLVALIVGWLFAAEPIGASQVFALILVLAGVIITQFMKQKTADTPF